MQRAPSRLTPSLLLLSALPLCFVVSACDDGDETPAAMAPDAEPPLRTPTPYVPDVQEETVSPALDQAGLNASVAEHLPRLAQVQVAVLPALISALIDLEDPECPGGEVYEGPEGARVFALGSDGCVTAAGVQFRGYMTLRLRSEAEGEAFTLESEGVQIEHPDGRFLHLAGYIETHHEREDEGVGEGLYLEGTFRADEGTARAHPWLAEGAASRVARFVYRHVSGEVFMELSTALSFSEGPLSAIQVQGLRVNTWLCDDEPLGSVSVREANGVWHDLIYDGFEEEAEAPIDTCDGCGQHLAAGVSVDPVCEAPGWMAALVEGIQR